MEKPREHQELSAKENKNRAELKVSRWQTYHTSNSRFHRDILSKMARETENDVDDQADPNVFK